MKRTQNIKGFTIIEVVLVLAIAGLIFLMVFIALPALQAGQRDTARKNDAGHVITAVNNYTSNNRGAFPATAAALGTYNAATSKWSGYMDSVSSNTTSLTLNVAKPATVTATDANAIILSQRTCSSVAGAVATLAAGTARQYAVVTLLEAGGGTAFCQDS
jgi:prepilin-type N-terminal cleavage/methylation domain-containing protein